jgi:hypothetical protein
VGDLVLKVLCVLACCLLPNSHTTMRTLPHLPPPSVVRYDLFTKAFTHISQAIDGIYKELTKSSSFPLGGTAYLSLMDTSQPFLDGIKYHAMPPMKRFRDMELLSG